MGFLKKNIKWIIAIIVGIVIASGISVYATSTYLASDISYKSTTVASALNDLYLVAQSGVGNNYSTSEQVIGTWIDGKTVYQKTFILDTVVSDNNQFVGNIGDNLSEVIDIRGTIKYTTGVVSNIFRPIVNAQDLYIDENGGIWCINKNYAGTMRITLKYTKIAID